jgi:hypothetical protein
VPFSRDSLPALELGLFGTVEYKEREERHTHKLRTTEEQSAKLGVLALSPMHGVKEPDGCVDADAETAEVGRVSLKAINNSNVGKRASSANSVENRGACQYRNRCVNYTRLQWAGRVNIRLCGLPHINNSCEHLHFPVWDTNHL